MNNEHCDDNCTLLLPLIPFHPKSNGVDVQGIDVEGRAGMDATELFAAEKDNININHQQRSCSEAEGGERERKREMADCRLAVRREEEGKNIV